MDPEGDTRREHVFTSGRLRSGRATESRLPGTNTRRHRAVTPVPDLFIVFNYNADRINSDWVRNSHALITSLQYVFRF